jgi:acetyl esterase/lipase
MVAATADYRVRKRHKVLPDKCVEDAKSAVRWMRQNAKKLGIDPNRIAAAGGSAGAHLAVCTALTTGLEAPGEEHAISSKPNALVLFNPVLDLLHPRLIERLNGNEALARQISPLHNLKKGAPPTLLLFGTEDWLIDQFPPFIARAKELGNRVELYTAEGAKHGFFNRSPWFERTLARADEFLVSIGYLPGKPTTRPSRPD